MHGVTDRSTATDVARKYFVGASPDDWREGGTIAAAAAATGGDMAAADRGGPQGTIAAVAPVDWPGRDLYVYGAAGENKAQVTGTRCGRSGRPALPSDDFPEYIWDIFHSKYSSTTTQFHSGNILLFEGIRMYIHQKRNTRENTRRSRLCDDRNAGDTRYIFHCGQKHVSLVIHVTYNIKTIFIYIIIQIYMVCKIDALLCTCFSKTIIPNPTFINENC